MAKMSSILTNIFLLLLLIQIAPGMIKNIKSNYTEYLENKTKVGLISIKNVISDSTHYVRDIKKFFEQDDIKAILLKMDCPGGNAGASQAIFNEIKELKKIHLKPVVVWVQNVCASGGYYIACTADHIIATPSAFVGSIGVYIPQPHLKQFIEQFKIRYNSIDAGTYKTAGNPLLDVTPEQQKMLKGLVDDTYVQFTTDVAEQRPKLTLHTVSTWADGKVFTGKQALELGLVDELGSQITAEQYIKHKLIIEGGIEWVRPACVSNLSKLFKGDCEDDDAGDEKGYITSAVHALCSYIDNRFTLIAQ
jgi:protease-4